MHIKRNESLFHLKIKTYLKRIILLHNTNIASHSLLIRKFKYIQKNAAEHKKHQESLSFEQKGQTNSIDAAAHKRKYELLTPEKKSKTHGNQD
jgi:hypothetical protein